MLKLKSVMAAVGLSVVAATTWAADITGAGATFPYPIYAKWAEAYKKETGTGLNYQSIGSSGGIRQIRAKTVTFGASDAPVPGADLDKDGMVQFPAIIGGTVPVVNLEGFKPGELRITGPVMAEMFMGKITKWNDPKLVEMNRGVALPNLAIAPVYRADGSGTTFVWVSYLSAVSPEWKSAVGVGTSVKWPAGTGARGNEGVAGTVRNTRGAIGYVENAYAIQNKLVSTQIRNKAGNFVSPSHETFIAAAENADWSTPNFAANLIDQPGANSWPIVSPTFILLPRDPKDAARAANVMKFFDWAFTNGAKLAEELEYIPIPKSVQDAVRAAWKSQVKGPDGRPVM